MLDSIARSAAFGKNNLKFAKAAKSRKMGSDDDDEEDDDDQEGNQDIKKAQVLWDQLDELDKQKLEHAYTSFQARKDAAAKAALGGVSLASSSSSSSSCSSSSSSSASSSDLKCDLNTIRFPFDIKYPDDEDDEEASYVTEIVSVLSMHHPDIDILSSTKSLKNTLFHFTSKYLGIGGPQIKSFLEYVKEDSESSTFKLRFKYANLNAPWGWKLATWEHRGWDNMDYLFALLQLVALALPDMNEYHGKKKKRPRSLSESMFPCRPTTSLALAVESGNVFHVKPETKKYQYAKVTGIGSTVYETVNPASEHIQLDRGSRVTELRMRWLMRAVGPEYWWLIRKPGCCLVGILRAGFR
eukprot:g61155.t1